MGYVPRHDNWGQGDMVRMGTVWDRTTEVLSGRAGMLAGIAALTLFAPAVIDDVVQFAIVGNGPAPVPASGPALLIALIGFVVALVTIFGQLALIAAASDPANGRREAFGIAGRRILPTIGLFLLLGLVFLVLILPLVFILLVSGVDLEAVRAGRATMPAGIAGTALLYFVVLFVIGLWINARLAVLLPVIVNERLGIGAFRRSVALTRGSAWRIIGVMLLFAIVALVVVLATQAVAGVVFRLILGAENIALALLLTGIVVAAVTAGLTLIYTTFVAQLYVATRGAATDDAPVG